MLNKSVPCSSWSKRNSQALSRAADETLAVVAVSSTQSAVAQMITF